jgi:mannitol/fructose-specific phosphotransferase system IIA component (Ntr-type)
MRFGRVLPPPVDVDDGVDLDATVPTGTTPGVALPHSDPDSPSDMTSVPTRSEGATATDWPAKRSEIAAVS